MYTAYRYKYRYGSTLLPAGWLRGEGHSLDWRDETTRKFAMLSQLVRLMLWGDQTRFLAILPMPTGIDRCLSGFQETGHGKKVEIMERRLDGLVKPA